MARVLGANATGGTLWFVLAVDGHLTGHDPVSFELAAGLSHAKALEAGRTDLAATLTRLQVDLVALAEPEVSKQTYQALRPRMSVELVLEFAAAKAGVELERLTRARMRSKLELGRAGSIDSHVGAVVDAPLNPHWKKKRDVAALAALACD